MFILGLCNLLVLVGWGEEMFVFVIKDWIKIYGCYEEKYFGDIMYIIIFGKFFVYLINNIYFVFCFVLGICINFGDVIGMYIVFMYIVERFVLVEFIFY